MILSSSTYLYVKVEISRLINDVNYKVDCHCWAFLFIIYNITSNWSIRFSCSSALQGVHFAWNIISYIMFQHTIVINGDGDPDGWNKFGQKRKKWKKMEDGQPNKKSHPHLQMVHLLCCCSSLYNQRMRGW